MEDRCEIKADKKGQNSLKVSVAMATYNGAKFIEEQLLSICRQTRKPDEIVVSDDGSKDQTLEIVDRVSKSEDARGITFVVLTDNPRHGYCGNFEWAITHTTGNLIFLSDQDDIWVPEKVELMLAVFDKHPEAECVCHNATLIGKTGKPIDGVFDERFSQGTLDIPKGEIIRIERDIYLEQSVSWGGIHGMSLCLSRKLAQDIVPFPKTKGYHDKWITVCSIMNNSMYYLNMPLALYRLHGNNTCGNSAYRGSAVDKVRKIWGALKNNRGAFDAYYQNGIAIQERLTRFGFAEHDAYKTASRLVEIGTMVYDAEVSGRINGAVKLCKLFATDMRYRRSGTSGFVQELIYIIRVGKNERQKNIGYRGLLNRGNNKVSG